MTRTQTTRRRGPAAPGLVPGCLVLVCMAGGCGSGSGESGLDQPRLLAPDVEPPRLGRSHAERFGFAEEPGSGAAQPQLRLAWNLPEGWENLPPTQFRTANFGIDGDPELECYLTELGGDGGGLLANVNRWRGQMSLAPIGEAELAALPRRAFIGTDAVVLDLEGAFAGMGGTARPGYRMIGLLAVRPTVSHFLKFTGPSEMVDAHLDAFDEVARSFRVEAASGSADEFQPPPRSTTRAPSSLTWQVPEGWFESDPRPMREVTLVPESSPRVECYVTVLGGDGGGVRANLDRWRGQMGQPDLTDAEFGALERVPMLGGKGLWIAIDGDYAGMGGAEQQAGRMLGAVAGFAGSTVFVKMVGPRDEVAAEEPRFLEFLSTLAPAGS